jgi:hypothetical protein
MHNNMVSEHLICYTADAEGYDVSRPEHARAVCASHWPFTSVSSQLSEHLLNSFLLHMRVVSPLLEV